MVGRGKVWGLIESQSSPIEYGRLILVWVSKGTSMVPSGAHKTGGYQVRNKIA